MKEKYPKLKKTCLKFESVSTTVIFIRYENHHHEIRGLMPTEEKDTRLIANISRATLLAGSWLNNVFKVLKFYFPPSILYPVKLSLKYEGRISICKNMESLAPQQNCRELFNYNKEINQEERPEISRSREESTKWNSKMTAAQLGLEIKQYRLELQDRRL